MSEHHLFIDTSYDLRVGLLDSYYHWEDRRTFKNQKSTVLLHSEINKILQDYSITVHDLSSIITVNGPGSYTGLKVAEGIAQIFEWKGIRKLSFYHYDPFLLMKEVKVIWTAFAYKDEFFVAEMNQGHLEKKLIKAQDFFAYYEMMIGKQYVFYGANSERFNESVVLKSSDNYLIENSEIIFEKIFENNFHQDIFYFRPIDVEFMVKK